MSVRSRGECWQSVAGGQKGGLYSVKSLSSPKEGTACWESQGVHHHIHSFFGTHTPDVSVPTNTRTISQTPSVVCFLGGPLLTAGLLLGPAQVALHLHKLWGVLLLLLNFLLLKLQLPKDTLTNL